jgi:hypothetical protein
MEARIKIATGHLTVLGPYASNEGKEEVNGFTKSCKTW